MPSSESARQTNINERHAKVKKVAVPVLRYILCYSMFLIPIRRTKVAISSVSSLYLQTLCFSFHQHSRLAVLGFLLSQHTLRHSISSTALHSLCCPGPATAAPFYHFINHWAIAYGLSPVGCIWLQPQTNAEGPGNQASLPGRVCPAEFHVHLPHGPGITGHPQP